MSHATSLLATSPTRSLVLVNLNSLRIFRNTLPKKTAKMSSSDPQSAIPDSSHNEPDLPLTMASSMILTSLPRDAASALSTAGDFPKPKVTVHFKAVGSAPSLDQKVCRISSSQRFETVVAYLRRKLKVNERDSVFLYVNSTFAPALDEVVGNLHRVSAYFLVFDMVYGLLRVFGDSVSRIRRTSLLSLIR